MQRSEKSAFQKKAESLPPAAYLREGCTVTPGQASAQAATRDQLQSVQQAKSTKLGES